MEYCEGQNLKDVINRSIKNKKKIISINKSINLF